jgi:hypothetical protein
VYGDSLPCPVCMNRTLLRHGRDRWACGWSRSHGTGTDGCSVGCTTAAIMNDEGSFTESGLRMALEMDAGELRHALTRV